MEDNLIFLKNERQPQFLENGRRPQFFGQKGGQPQFQGKGKTTSISRKMEEDRNFMVNGR